MGGSSRLCVYIYMLRAVLIAALAASSSAFAPVSSVPAQMQRTRTLEMGAKKGGVNPALFSTGYTKAQEAAAAKNKKDKNAPVDPTKKAGILGLFNRPNPKDVRYDGSFKSPKPWEKQTGVLVGDRGK